MSDDRVLWYCRPAEHWLEALPVGNGRLGAMVFGGIGRERLALSESTVWSGAPSTAHDNPSGQAHLGDIRQMLFDGEYLRAGELCAEHLLGRKGSYGTHLPMADLLLDAPRSSHAVTAYRRYLDLDAGIAGVEYVMDGARYNTEVFASHPDNLLVIRLTCDQPGRLTWTARLDAGARPFRLAALRAAAIALSGQAFERTHSDGATGVNFVIHLHAVPVGGSLAVDAGSLTINAADSITFLLAANTNYLGRDPDVLCRRQIEAAAGMAYAQGRAAHTADYRRLFGRVALDLGGDRSGQPTDARLAAVQAGADDPGLCTLFFHYARYVLIAGSRADSPLPLNLQGIWNDDAACKMAWTNDFHFDINTQQSYWPAEVCNLGECAAPLFRLIESLREPGRRTARLLYGARGWVCHVYTNAWGFTAPGWGSPWGLHPTGGIWVASHLWEHFLFTRDTAFLAGEAYPILREAAQFFLDYLVEHPRHGFLVSGPAISPENAFLTPAGSPAGESMGPTCDQVLIADLFASCIEASRVLGVDAEFRADLAAAAARLAPLAIGKYGQLREWLEDFEEAIPNHRHTSHLIALHPGSRITPRATPEWAQAARVSIERRLGRPDWEDVEWSRANLINYYARLGDGEAAHLHLLGLLRESTALNLLTFSRSGIAGAGQAIFAVDGNLAGCAGMVEMLVQSHAGEIHLLPALPRAWPVGYARGLRCRGGLEIDLAWEAGALTSATLRCIVDATCTVRYQDRSVLLRMKAGDTIRLDADSAWAPYAETLVADPVP